MERLIIFRPRKSAFNGGACPGDDHRLALTLAQLGKTLLDQNQAVEAQPLLRECLAIREKKLPDDWLRFNAQSLLGGSLMGQKKYADAEPLLLQGYEGLKQREAKIPPQWRFRLSDFLGVMMASSGPAGSSAVGVQARGRR